MYIYIYIYALHVGMYVDTYIQNALRCLCPLGCNFSVHGEGGGHERTSDSYRATQDTVFLTSFEVGQDRA